MQLNFKLKTVLIALILISLSGCGNGYFYETNATYLAEISNLKVDLTSTGHVLDGDDLTDGLTTGIISSEKFTDTIHFQSNTKAFTWLKINNTNNLSSSLRTCFDKIGYSNYHEQELDELKKVILATAYGPKATYVNAQTDLIKVINVTFETHRGFQKKE